MILPIIFLLIGVVCGRLFGFRIEDIDTWITAMLCVVVFAAGIDVGSKRIVFHKLREYHAKVLLIPLGTMIGSVGTGVLLGKILGIPMNEAAAVAAGVGYYSLSAGILAGLGGPGLGALTFVANILRELLSFALVPLLAKYIKPQLVAIAPAGATSMDTTLGIISHCTDEEVMMIAMINGVVLSAVVPVMVPMFFRLSL